MNIENANKIRKAAGLPDLTREERVCIEEKYKSKSILTEAANNRPSSKTLCDIAKQYLHVRTLDKTGDDNKDYHDCPVWAIESALKAAYKAGQQSAPKSIKESTDTSAEEAKRGSGTRFDPKGGDPVYKCGDDSPEKESGDQDNGPSKGKSAENYQTPKNKTAKDVTEAKKLADNDYDNDGKIESPENEYKGSRDKAIKKATKKKTVTEMGSYSENEENYKSSYKRGQTVKCHGKIMVVHVPDAQADYVGVIPYNLKNASKDRKDDAVKHVHASELRPASMEDNEDAEMMHSYEDNMWNMGEGSSEEYNNPKGSTLKSDSKSGAKKDHPNAYKKVVHKDDSEKYGHEKSREKSRKGLKRISEQDATVWDKDYNMDGQVDKDESPDQLAVADPNATDKIPVPSRLKTVMRNEIKQLREEADKVHVRDPIGSEFYRNTADAFENLLSHLEEGTKRSMALAQIDVNRVMSPMVTRIPNEVYMFIVRGGKPASLTELFKEVKIKRESGADLSKEDYTK